MSWGAGPRASRYLILGAKALTAMEGRPMPDLEDVAAMALPVLSHRGALNFKAGQIRTDRAVGERTGNTARTATRRRIRRDSPLLVVHQHLSAEPQWR